MLTNPTLTLDKTSRSRLISLCRNPTSNPILERYHSLIWKSFRNNPTPLSPSSSSPQPPKRYRCISHKHSHSENTSCRNPIECPSIIPGQCCFHGKASMEYPPKAGIDVKSSRLTRKVPCCVFPSLPPTEGGGADAGYPHLTLATLSAWRTRDGAFCRTVSSAGFYLYGTPSMAANSRGGSYRRGIER